MLELAPLPAAPQTTPTELPSERKLSEAVPEPQEPPPVDLKPMKIEVQTAAPPPPVEVPLAEVVLPPPEPPPPVDFKPPDKPKPVERPRPAQPKPHSGGGSALEAAPAQAPHAAAPAPAMASAPSSAGLPNWKGALSRVSSGTSAIPRKRNAPGVKVSPPCA